MSDRRLPDSAYNWTSVVGVMLVIASLSIMLILFLIEWFVRESSVYMGLVIYIVMPVFLVAGLALIALGMHFERRRQLRGDSSRFTGEIRVDLRLTTHRNATIIFMLGTGLFLMLSTVGMYQAYHHTESVEFCGTTCHDVMKPEYTAYQNSAHARVSCAECHIGGGADWYVRSKLSGAYQVYAVLADVYPKPIPTPVANLRPARETCQQCHWPEQSFGSRQDLNYHFLADEENTAYPISMLVHVGSGDGEDGVHWHVSKDNKVEYIARDEKLLDIAWVRMTGPDGESVVYHNEGEPLSEEEIATLPRHTMDCMDCHNRPSHNYLSPNRTVNEALGKGTLDRELPYLKMQAITLLDVEYEDTPSALKAIDEGLRNFYAEEYPDVLEEQAPSVEQAVATLQDIYSNNFFPEMKVSWRQYPDHIGHSEFIGCFRCHGEVLASEEGEYITGDCSTCHTIIAQGEGDEGGMITPTGLEFIHPEDIDGEELESPCSDCHEGGAEQY
ncbi:MAG: hypothetical protein ACI8PG_001342 [Planctomycetota bacterium]|jgi:hypothetical protein